MHDICFQQNPYQCHPHRLAIHPMLSRVPNIIMAGAALGHDAGDVSVATGLVLLVAGSDVADAVVKRTLVNVTEKD